MPSKKPAPQNSGAIATPKLAAIQPDNSVNDPIDTIHNKIHIATEALRYLGARPLADDYSPFDEADALELQRHRYIDLLDTLNIQLAVVMANKNSVVPPTADQIAQVQTAVAAVENLNANQAIAGATLAVLNSALGAAQPLVKS